MIRRSTAYPAWNKSSIAVHRCAAAPVPRIANGREKKIQAYIRTRCLEKEPGTVRQIEDAIAAGELASPVAADVAQLERTIASGHHQTLPASAVVEATLRRMLSAPSAGKPDAAGLSPASASRKKEAGFRPAFLSHRKAPRSPSTAARCSSRTAALRPNDHRNRTQIHLIRRRRLAQHTSSPMSSS